MYLPMSGIKFLRWFTLALLASWCGAHFTAQGAEEKAEILDNSDVVRLVTAGLSSELIVAKIEQSECKFDVSTDALIGLKKSGVPSKVLTAMIERNTQGRKAQGTDPGATANRSPPVKPSLQEAIRSVQSHLWGCLGYVEDESKNRFFPTLGTFCVDEETIFFMTCHDCPAQWARGRPDRLRFSIPWDELEHVCLDEGPNSTKLEIHARSFRGQIDFIRYPALEESSLGRGYLSLFSAIAEMSGSFTTASECQ